MQAQRSTNEFVGQGTHTTESQQKSAAVSNEVPVPLARYLEDEADFVAFAKCNAIAWPQPMTIAHWQR